MARKFSKSFYNSKRWKDIAEQYRQMKFSICERCGRTNARQVHHKIYLSPNNIYNYDISLNFDNLELLCDTCHQKEHFEKFSPVVQGCCFDENGQLIKKTP